MEPFSLSLILFATATMVLLAVVMNVIHKEVALVSLYMVQSLMVTVLLLVLSWRDHVQAFLIVAFLTIAVKVILTPTLFWRLVRQHRLRPTVSTLLSLPLTLLVLLILLIAPYSGRFTPLTHLGPMMSQTAALLLSSLFISFFLLINRRGVLSQVIGILAMENSIVAFSSLLGEHQAVSLELGVMFDSTLWVIVAIVLATLINRHFGTLDTKELSHLTE